MKSNFIKRFSVCIIFVAAVFLSGIIYADNTAKSSGIVLRMPVGARPIGLGGAFISLAENADALYWNPAGLGFSENPAIMFSHNNYILDVRHNYLAGVFPLKKNKWTLGGFITLLDYGTFDHTEIVNENTARWLGGYEDKDFVLGFEGAGRINNNLAVGAGLKYLKSDLHTFSASALALDLGMKYKMDKSLPVSFAVTAKNIGTKLKYDSKSENLPLSLTGGCNADFELGKIFRLIPAISLGYSNTSDVQFNFGTEFLWFNSYALRVGYDSLNDAGSGFTAGAGVKLKNFSLDYAYLPFNKLGINSHNISMSFGFGDYAREDSKKITNNVMKKLTNMRLFPTTVFISPFRNPQETQKSQFVKTMLEYQVRAELEKPNMKLKIASKNTVNSYLNMIKKDVVNSEEEAFAIGLLSMNDMIVYGNIMILESGKIMFYYKVFNAFDRKIILEGILEFNENQTADAAKIFTKEIFNR